MKNKATLKFTMYVLACMAVGVGIAVTLIDTGVAIGTFFGGLGRWLYVYYVPGQMGAAVVLFGMTAAFYQKAKRLSAGPEDEEAFAFEKGDMLLGNGMMSLSILSTLSFTLFGVFAIGMTFYEREGVLHGLLWGLFPVLVFFLAMTGAIYGEAKIIGLIKVRNPEKKGNPLDFHFQKDWLASCDEAERYVIYNASYKSFQTLRYAIIFLWAIGVVAGLFLGTGLLPVVMMGILFGIHGISYQRNVRQFSKHKISE